MGILFREIKKIYWIDNKKYCQNNNLFIIKKAFSIRGYL